MLIINRMRIFIGVWRILLDII